MRLPTCLSAVITVFCLLIGHPVYSGSDNLLAIQSVHFVNTVPDISGLAWLEGDCFLAVHDAKNPDENDRPRISMLWLPKSLEGITWKPLALSWPLPQGPSSDLESIARIPGTDLFLLIESGEPRVDRGRFRRLFLIEIRNKQAVLLSSTELPEHVKNIEGSAVTRVGNSLIFVCAERGDSQQSTEMYWTHLQLQPLRLGSFRRDSFKPVGYSGRNKRPVSAIDVDSMGRVFIASAYDPNDDNGPFSSVIWRAGRFFSDGNNGIRLVLARKPRRLATLDSLKVEGLAIREKKAGLIELFAGTDDENYGGALRAIPIGD